MKTNITTKVTGNIRDGYVLKLHNKLDNFTFDESFTREELESMAGAIIKKLI